MSIWIPCVQAYLHAGDFVLASPQEGAVPLVGRIMGGSTVNGIQVTWWLSRNELLQIAGVEAVPLLSAQTHRNVQLCKIVEVTERVLSISEISTNLVTDLAFVFHADTLENNLVDCAGMSRVFYTRYKYDCNDNLMKLRPCQVAPFSRFGLYDSYPCRIWHSVLDVKDLMRKALNDRRQFQGLRKSVSVRLPLESWYYLLHRFHVCRPIFVEYSRSQTEKRMHCNLSLSSCSSRITLKLLRIDSIEAMLCARDIFGITFGVGIRNTPPKKGERARSMHHGDVVNVVHVAQNAEIPNAQRQREVSYSEGVDFIYNEVSRLLKVRVRYSRVLAQDTVVAATLGLRQPVEPCNNVRFEVSIGTMFTRGEELLTVVSVNGDDVRVCGDDGMNYVITLGEAITLLEAFIGD